MPFQVESFGLSDIGRMRSNNEDVWAALPEKKFYILADGMGGHQAGEVAACLSMESMCSSISSLKDNPTIEETCMHLREAVAKANKQVFDAARSSPTHAGMGTTLSCCILLEESLIYAHVGDSRLYRLRNQKLEQLTEDHCPRQLLFTREKKTPPPRHVITRAIGNVATILPDVGVISLMSKDIYMFCSDGLSDYVEKKFLAEQLSSSLPLEEMGKNLVKAALEKGGNDNITLLLIRVGERDEKNLFRQ